MANFRICRRCGNLAELICDGGVPMSCCGQEMEALRPNTTEASGEKHLPVVSAQDSQVRVNVGSASHPMTPEHLIEWVYLQTRRGAQRKRLTPTDPPEVSFRLEDDQAEAVYAYCNLTGFGRRSCDRPFHIFTVAGHGHSP